MPVSSIARADRAATTERRRLATAARLAERAQLIARLAADPEERARYLTAGPEVFSAAEAAAVLGWTLAKIYRALKTGGIPALPGRAVRIPRRALLRLLESGVGGAP